MKVYEVLNKTTDIQHIINRINECEDVPMDVVRGFLAEYKSSLLALNVKEDI